MNHVTTGMPTVTPPVFEATDGDADCMHWGMVLSVFAKDLAEAVAELNREVPGTEELLDDVQAAARKFGLMLEGLCLNDSRAVSPCLLYDCADGFRVLLVQQQATTAGMVRRAAEAFDGAQASVPESLFVSLLSKAMKAFFDREVVQPLGLVTIQLDGCDYIFMRAEHCDEVLRDLKIGTTAGVF